MTSGVAQIKAFEQALASAQVSYDSNKLGLEVGVRTNLDVLNQQQQVFQTRFNLAQAYYNFLISELKLKQAVGTLDRRRRRADQPRPGRLSARCAAPSAAARARTTEAVGGTLVRRVECARRLRSSPRVARGLDRIARRGRDQRIGIGDDARAAPAATAPWRSLRRN